MNYILIGARIQQCPLDLPYAFRGGKECCRYEEDEDGNPLDFFSLTCKNSVQAFCSADRCITNGDKFKYIAILLYFVNIIQYIKNDNIILILPIFHFQTTRMGHNLYNYTWRDL